MAETAIPVNDALNRPRLKFGISWWLFLAFFILAALTAIFVNLILGAVLLLALPAAARRITRHEPQIFRLWRLSWSQRAHYDPGKVRR